MAARLLETFDTPEAAEAAKHRYADMADDLGLAGWIIHVRPIRMPGKGNHHIYGVWAGRHDEKPPPAAKAAPRHEPVSSGRPSILTAEQQEKIARGLAVRFPGWEFWASTADAGRRVTWHARRSGESNFLSAARLGNLERAVQLRIQG